MRMRQMDPSLFAWLVTAMISLCCVPTRSQTPIRAQVSSPSLTAYGGCSAPSNEGFNICSPQPISGSSIPSPLQFIAAATSGRGQVERIELWADGRRVAHSLGSLFDRPVSLSQGMHVLTFREIDQTGAAVESTPFAVDVNQQFGAVVASPPTEEDGDQKVSQSCPTPAAPGVNVCSPPALSCSPSGILTIDAAGRGKRGEVRRMELWINGTKIANFPGNYFLTDLLLYGSSYVITINEVDEEGNTIGQTLQYDGPC